MSLKPFLLFIGPILLNDYAPLGAGCCLDHEVLVAKIVVLFFQFLLEAIRIPPPVATII